MLARENILRGPQPADSPLLAQQFHDFEETRADGLPHNRDASCVDQGRSLETRSLSRLANHCLQRLLIERAVEVSASIREASAGAIPGRCRCFVTAAGS